MMLRAVIYCRCSTEEESQQEALKNQVAEAKESVRAQGWLLVDCYIESKSGTTAGNRKEYQRLFEDLRSDKFDIVQIKSQDRLMRNTKDWYLFIDRLASCGKKLYMYMEQKFYTPDDALITGIKAILAEEYSRELSKKINNAHRARQRRGETFMLPPETYGYRKLPDKTIVVVEEEAAIIRLMFRLCLAMGCGSIAAALEREGYRGRRGQLFQEETIRKIIRNPLRCGTVVQNRRHFDFQQKREIAMPQEDWVVHRQAIPAIVSEELWRQANAAMDARAGKCRGKARSGNQGTVESVGVSGEGGTGEVVGAKTSWEERPQTGSSGRFAFSGKIRCGLCGGTYYRTSRSRGKDREKVVEWKCRNYLRYGRRAGGKARPSARKTPGVAGKGCDNIHLKETELFHFLENIYMTYGQDGGTKKQEILGKTMDILRRALDLKTPARKSGEILHKLEHQEELGRKLVDKLLEGVLQDGDYRRKKAEIDATIEHLREELEECQRAEEGRPESEARLRGIRERLEGDILRKAVFRARLKDIAWIEVFEDRIRIRLSDGEDFTECLGR